MNDRVKQQVSDALAKAGADVLDLGKLANVDARRIKLIPILARTVLSFMASRNTAFNFQGWPEGCEIVDLAIEHTQQGAQFVFVAWRKDWPAVMPGTKTERIVLSIKAWPVTSADRDPSQTPEGVSPAPSGAGETPEE